MSALQVAVEDPQSRGWIYSLKALKENSYGNKSHEKCP
jgi:hypothetical protein